VRRASPSERLLRQLPFQFGDLSGAGRDVVRQFDARAFERAVRLARQLEILAQLLGFAFERGGLAFYLIEFGAQRVIGGARFRQHAGQADGLRLFLLERAQRRVERLNDLVESLFELVEFANLAAGVAQKIAQGFVFFAHARADVGITFDNDRAAAAMAVPAVGVGAGTRRIPVGVGLTAFAAKNIRQLSHGKRLQRGTQKHAGQCHRCTVKVLYTMGD
jgi:hypothetical protein